MSRSAGDRHYFVRLTQEFVQIDWTKWMESVKLDI